MQLEFFDVPSPCIGVCQSDEKGFCKGCMRSRDERQQWIAMDSDEKQKVIKRCKTRLKRKQKKQWELEHPTSEQHSIQSDDTKQNEVIQPSLLDPPVKSTISHDNDFNFDDFEL